MLSSPPESCSANTVPRSECRLYVKGHAIHTIQARLATNSPWGWRDGIVSAAEGLEVKICYVESSHDVACWHHRDMAASLPQGTPVRVHEALGVLATPQGWLSTDISDGLGSVPTPLDAWTWAAETYPVIVDVVSGAAEEIR